MISYIEIKELNNCVVVHTDNEKYPFTLIKGVRGARYYGNYISSINRYGRRCLYHCYANHSQAKDRAEDYCYNMFYAMGGYDSTIVSYNTCVFVFGFMFMLDNEKYLAYITRDNNYLVKIKE